MSKAVCSLNIDYSGTTEMLQFMLVGSITYKNHNKVRAVNNFVLTREGYIPQISFEIILDRLFKKICLTDMFKKALIRTALEKRFREFSDMMKECFEDGSIKISNKKPDRYVLKKPAMFHYRKYMIFKDNRKSELTIDFEQPAKKPFVIPFVNEPLKDSLRSHSLKSHSEGSFQGTIDKMLQTTVDNWQGEFCEILDEPLNESFKNNSQDTLNDTFQDTFYDTSQDIFCETFDANPWQ